MVLVVCVALGVLFVVGAFCAIGFATRVFPVRQTALLGVEPVSEPAKVEAVEPVHLMRPSEPRARCGTEDARLFCWSKDVSTCAACVAVLEQTKTRDVLVRARGAS